MILLRAFKAAALCIAIGVLAPMPASASITRYEPVSISPNGRWAVRMLPLEQPAERGVRVVVIDLLCIFQGETYARCSAIQLLSRASAASAQITWDTKDDRFNITTLGQVRPYTIVVSSSAVALEEFGQTRANLGTITPSVAELDALDRIRLRGKDRLPDGARAITDRNGYLSGYWNSDENGVSVAQRSKIIPLPVSLAYQYQTGSLYRIIPELDRHDFCIWSASWGASGKLACISNGIVHESSAPSDLAGPANLVIDQSTSALIGFSDAFGFSPSGGQQWLNQLEAHVASLRTANPGFELLEILTSSEAETAILRFRENLLCEIAMAYREGRSRELFRECNKPLHGVYLDLPETKKAWRVEPVLIPGPRYSLPGRLYSSENEKAQARGLLVTFHGGPHLSATEEPPLAAAIALGDSFDILAVDYRGSSGHGWSHMTAAHAAVASTAAEDLGLVAAWLDKEGVTKAQRVGFWGDSYGGIAAHLIPAHDAAYGFDFVISSSGLIEHTVEEGNRICRQGGWKGPLFGSFELDTGNCQLKPIGVLDQPVRSRIPVLDIVGSADRQVSRFGLDSWARRAVDEGGCSSQLVFRDGGHGYLSWGRNAVEDVVAYVASWVELAMADPVSACGQVTELS